MFCPNCGNKLAENATSCGNCGQSITQGSSDNIVQQNMQQPIQSNANSNTNMYQSPVSEDLKYFQEQQNPTTTEFTNANQTFVPDVKKQSFSKNKIITLAIVLVVLTGAFLGISYFLKGDSKQQEILAYFDVNKPIRIRENNLYGYIDSNGKTIISPQYKNAQDFVDKYAIVQLPVDESGSEYFAFIDTKGNVVLKTTLTYGGSIEYFSEYEIWYIDGRLYNKNLSSITAEGIKVSKIGNGYFSFMETNSVGIMDSNGKVTYSMKTNGEYLYFAADTDDIEYPDLKEIYCQTNIGNEKYGIVNCKTGKVVLDYTEKYISADENNVFDVSNKSTYELYERIYVANDRIAYRVTDRDARLEYIGNNILEVGKEWPYQYFDVKNNKTLDQRPNYSDVDIEDALELLRGFKEVSCDEGGYGIMKNDKFIVPCGWDKITYLDDPLYSYAESKGKQLVLTRKDGKMNLYDIKTSKVIVNFNTSSVSGTYGDSVFIYYKDEDTKKTVVYNVMNGKQQAFDESVSISNNSNYFTVKTETKVEYYNTNFKHIYTGSVN